MKDKLNNIPMPVIAIAVVAVLGLAGFFMFRTAQSQNGSYTVPMDREKYMERMKEQAAQNQGQGQQYGTPAEGTQRPRPGMRPGMGGPGAGGPGGAGAGSMGR